MVKKEKYDELSNQVLELIGGKENISFFTHCMTRLRFNLKDKSIVDLKKISGIKGVIGCQWQGQSDQLQIIIGQDVSDAYNLICKKNGLSSEESINENLDGGKSKFKFSIGNIFNAIIDAITGSMAPLIPMLIGAGMIKVLLILFPLFGLSTTSSTYTVLMFIGDAAFYFLPILVGATAARKFNTNVGLGMLMGAILIHPTFISLVNEGTPIELFGITVTGASYANQILPTIMSVWVMSHVERFFSRKSPTILRSVITPTLTIIVMAPLTLIFIAPLGLLIGNYITSIMIFIYETLGFVGVGLMAAVMPLIVMTGMHMAFMPYMVGSIATNGLEPFFLVAMVISNINQGAASAAVAVRAKSKNLKGVASSSAVTAIVGGITEPAMFGVTVKYKRPLYAAMIGSFIGGAYAGLMNVYAYAFPGSAGLLSFPIFIGPNPSNLVNFIVGIIIGAVVTFVLTLVFGFKEVEEDMSV